MILYYYEHCPFCTFVRAFAGIKGIRLKRQLMAFADIETPTELCGKKQAPILQKNDFGILIESQAIVQYLDALKDQSIAKDMRVDPDILRILQRFSSVHLSLTSPRFVQYEGIEFDQDADKERYRKREEALMSLSFEDALQRTQYLKDKMNELLDNQLLPTLKLKAFDKMNILTELELFVFMRKLTIVEGYQFPPSFESFYTIIKARTGLPDYSTIAI